MKKIKEIGAVGTIVLFAAVLLAGFLASCNKNQKEQVIQTRSNQSTDTTIVVEIDGIKFVSSLETMPDGNVYGVVVGTKTNGETQTWSYPLGGFNFPAIPVDTTLDVPTTTHTDFTTSHDSTSFDDMEIYHITKHTISGVDQYTSATFTKHPLLEWNNGSVDCWGYNIEFPRRYPTLAWASVTPSELGSDGTWDYTKFTIAYKISCFGMEMLKYGYHVTKREAGSHDFIEKYLANATWTPIAFSNGFVTRVRIDAKIGSRYEGLPDQFTEETVEVDCPVYIPGDSTVYANNFNYTYDNPVVGQEYVTGNYTSGNFHVTNKAINYSVVTSLFTRTSTFGWPEVVWTDGEYTFPMPYHAYGNFNEQHADSDLPAQNGYDRKRVTHTVYATINNNTGHAPINTYVLVESQTPPPPVEVDTTYQVETSGLTYVNQTTNTSWLKLRPVYSDGTSGTPFNKDITLENTVTCPQEGPFYTSNFDNVGVVGQVTMGTPELLEEYSSGEFLKRKYRQTAEINLGVFSLTWVLTYEKAIYTPLNYEMPYATYSCFVSSGSYTDDLGEITTQNETWLRKIWTQYMTTSFNQHNHQYAGVAEVRAPNTIPRITPEWLGNPLEAIYTRVQMAVGSQFMDMIVFRYEHGVVMAPNGVPDLNLVYAFTAADAAAHNVDQVYAAAAWYSGVYFDGKWWPAAITPNSGYTAWTYSYDGTPAHSHTVQRANAHILHIGYDYHPIPSHQYYTISNGVITICYNANNQGETVTAQCQLH